MPWKECDRMSQRQELVALASGQGISIAELARRFGVSRKTVYKWLLRHGEQGVAGLEDRSRRPGSSPQRTAADVELQVLALRGKHPTWGGRKLHHRLKRLGQPAPAPSTITRILREHGLIAQADHGRREHWQRFEHPLPNDLWQMDFKSPVELAGGGSCHPLTVIDDHSRYSLGLQACADQRHRTVHEQLTRVFERYGLPWAILSDNGSPWRCPRMDGSYTRLEVWLMRLDVQVRHGRPFHPQTQGKDERFHRTLDVEVLQGRRFRDRVCVQDVLDSWREQYNHERPHEALNMATPGERYRPSVRSMPSMLPTITYDTTDQVRRVDRCGQFRFHRRKLRAGKAFAGERIALRPTQIDGVWRVYYSRMRIGQVDLREVGPHEFAHVLRAGSGRCAPSAGPQDESEL